MMARIRGLYALTPDETDTGILLSKTARALEGGVSLVQYRNKTASASLRAIQARALLDLCRRHAVPLIINDHLNLALSVDADGLHLGGEDGDLAAARQALGPDKLLGASCYDRYDLALAAKAAGADHVAFGAAFSSPTKPGAARAQHSLYTRAANELGLPVVAIGGITRENAREVIKAGASAVAVISSLFDAQDIVREASLFMTLFGQIKPS